MKQNPFCILTAVAALLFVGSEVHGQGDIPRFEIGGQFSFLSVNKPATQSDILFREFFGDLDEPKVAEPGLGARFTYNLTNNVAFEAEGNFFPRRDGDASGPHGKIFQSQFGVKAGKRFKRIGLFLKMRPGFVRFTEASQFTGFKEATFISVLNREFHFENAEFRIGHATYLSADVGGVVEFYPSRRIVTRLDAGDTVIHYGIYREQAIVVCAAGAFFPCPRQLFERPAETRHSLQLSAGVGVRF